jgi:hypothetical protein
MMASEADEEQEKKALMETTMGTVETIVPLQVRLRSDGEVEKAWTRSSSVRMKDAARAIQEPNIFTGIN